VVSLAYRKGDVASYGSKGNVCASCRFGCAEVVEGRRKIREEFKRRPAI